MPAPVTEMGMVRVDEDHWQHPATGDWLVRLKHDWYVLTADGEMVGTGQRHWDTARRAMLAHHKGQGRF